MIDLAGEEQLAIRGPSCICFAVALASLFGVLLLPSNALAGSIFDDNWTPPSTSKPVTPPVPAQIQKNTPVPAAEPAKANEPPKPALPAVGARRAIPAPADQARSRKLFKEIFAKDLSDRSTAARRALAAKLLAQASTVSDAPADEFVLLAAATEAGREGSDLSILCNAADAMADAFEVDALRLKSDLATKMTLRAESSAVAGDNCQAGMKLADELVAAGDYQTASRLLQSLRSAAPTSEIAGQVQTRLKDVDLLRTSTAGLAAQLQKLKSSPGDPIANLAVGKYYCFIIGDWNAGLPFLLKGGDPALKSMAQQELGAGASQADVALADAWAAMAAKNRGMNQTRMQQRAVKWYDDALVSLSGLEKISVERKRGSQVAALSGLDGHRMSAEEISQRFAFPNGSFKVNGDAITGSCGNYDDFSTYVWLSHPEIMQAFECGLDLRARWFQTVVVDIDGQKYRYTRGFQGADARLDIMGKKRDYFPGKVKDPNDWASFKVVVEEGKVTFTYNGAVVGSNELVTPMTRSSKVNVGFSSHNSQISIKNLYILEQW